MPNVTLPTLPIYLTHYTKYIRLKFTQCTNTPQHFPLHSSTTRHGNTPTQSIAQTIHFLIPQMRWHSVTPVRNSETSPLKKLCKLPQAMLPYETLYHPIFLLDLTTHSLTIPTQGAWCHFLISQIHWHSVTPVQNSDITQAPSNYAALSNTTIQFSHRTSKYTPPKTLTPIHPTLSFLNT